RPCKRVDAAASALATRARRPDPEQAKAQQGQRSRLRHREGGPEIDDLLARHVVLREEEARLRLHEAGVEPDRGVLALIHVERPAEAHRHVVREQVAVGAVQEPALEVAQQVAGREPRLVDLPALTGSRRADLDAAIVVVEVAEVVVEVTEYEELA